MPLQKQPETDAPPETGDEQQGRIYLCDRCGCRMVEMSCKVVCPNCGSRYDCSDLNLYFD